jgi:flagellar biosynthesis GTPase FlhF
MMHRNGEGVAKDNVEAARLFRLAADQGDAKAQSELGRMHRNGEGVARDNVEAARLLRLAADQGIAEAQYYFHMEAAQPWIALLSTLLCGVAWVGWSTLRDGADRPERPRPGHLAHAPHKQVMATQHAAAKKGAKIGAKKEAKKKAAQHAAAKKVAEQQKAADEEAERKAAARNEMQRKEAERNEAEKRAAAKLEKERKDVARKAAEKQQAGAHMPLARFCCFGETPVLLCVFIFAAGNGAA